MFMEGAIDIHHHCVPKELIDETQRHGKALGVELSKNADGRFAISFDGSKPHGLQPALMGVDSRLDVMDKGKVAIAALAANTNSLGYRLSGPKGETWCKLYNASLKEFISKHPDRFVGLATVPLQDPIRAAKVLTQSDAELRFCGAFIGTNVNGQYYNSKDFDPFWAKAEELDLLLVMHPEHIAGADRMNRYGLNAVCGNPADSTLSLGYILYSGVFDRFPKLKLCVLHGGGFFPYHLGRFDQEYVTGRNTRPADALLTPSKYLKNLFFDSLVYHVDALEFLRKKVGGARLFLGTDYPYTLGDWMGVEKVEALDCSAAEKKAILQGNAKEALKL